MSWAHYILQVNIYLVVFYGFYKLLLDKETYFTLNRIYLVSAALLSLAIPFLRFEWFIKQAVTHPIYVSVGQLMGQVSIVEEESNVFSAGNLIVMVYITGILFFAVRFIFRLRSVNRKLKYQESGEAFSFFWKKRIDTNLPQFKTVHKHEDTHVRQWHSIDVLFFEILNIFTWFNPIIYFYKNSIKSIHEYLADDEAAKFQGDKDEYALLLLSSAFGVPVNTLINSFFNRSLIKRRIFMLHKQRSQKVAILKYGLAIPLFAIALVMSSATIRNNEKIQRITDNIPLNNPLEVVNEVVTASIEPIAPKLARAIHNKPIENMQGAAGWDQFYKFMKSFIRYPAAAMENKISGTTMIRFSVKQGEVEDLGVASRLGGGCDAEALKCVLQFPGYKSIPDGKYTLKVKFQINGIKVPSQNEIAPLKGYTALNEIQIIGLGKMTATRQDADSENKVFDFVSIETQPTFPGGMAKFYQYLKASIRYPAEAMENNVQGKVFLSFVVEKNGSLSDIRVERSLGMGTDEEAIRVLKASPRWVPGIQMGKAVRVKYNIPISFNSSDPKAPSPTPQNKQGSTTPSVSITGIRFADNNGGEIKIGDKAGKEPLVILDGVTTDMVAMKDFDPNKIESIDILKDAKATALYGEKAVNGVIIIRTKAKSLNEILIQPVKKDK